MAFAKTTRPDVAGAFTRSRLHRVLGRRGGRPITWVWGPPGAGKTTFVASYLAAQRCRSIWYQVDGGDTDIATFFYYLAQAAPRHRQPLPPLTPEYRAALDLFARRYFRELYRRLKPPFVLVLDNYHSVPVDAPLHDVLREAVQELPPGGRIIVISRTAPPPSMARFQFHQAVDILDWARLRVTAAEAMALSRKFRRRRHSDADVRRLHELTDGWMAGLVALLNLSDEERAAPPKESREVLFNYFANEIFVKATSRCRDILLRAAFLPAVQSDTAARLTGDPDAIGIVADMHRANCFTSKLEGPRAAYQFHPLFREFLVSQAVRTYEPSQLAEIRSAAAALCEAADDVATAADLLRDAGSWSGLAQLVCRHAPALLAQGRVDTIERWLACIPDATLAATPWLLCWRGICQLGRGHDRCRQDCERALSLFRAAQDVDGALTAWSAIVTSHLMEGWLEPIDSCILLLDQLFAEAASAPSPHVAARVATTMTIAIGFRQPGHPDGAQWAERALELTEGSPDVIQRAMAAFGWVVYHWMQGNPAASLRVIDEMRKVSLDRKAPSIVALHAAVPLVWHELSLGLRSYPQTVAEIREHAQATGLRHALSTSLVTIGALAALSDGNLELARPWVRELAEEAEGFGPTYTFAYHGVAALEALARNDLGRAKMHVEELALRGYSSGFVLDEVFAHATAAYVFCQDGNDNAAMAHVQRALEAASASRSPFMEWMARLSEAHVCFTSGRDAEGLHALGIAMRLGRAGGFINSQVWIPTVMAGLCARALDAGIEVDHVHDLVKLRRLDCLPPPVEIEAWPWPVKIVVLGRFAVLKDNSPLPSTRKAQRKPLALLRMLIAQGTPSVLENSVTDALWPDAHGDAARRALTTAVFRLRRLLGHDAAVIRADGQLAMNPAVCWVDLWAVERLLDRADEAAGRCATADAIRWTERAAALYCGDLIGADDEGVSSAPRGDRLRRRLLLRLVWVGRYWDTAEQWQRSVDAFEAALKVNPCAEDVYQSLMTAYHRLGRAAEVKIVYERCQHALERNAGLRPSAQTNGVLAALTNDIA